MFLNLVLGCSLIHVRYYISAIYSFVNLNVIVYILIQLQTQVRVDTDEVLTIHGSANGLERI